jgi:hypothetical protein
MEPTFTMQNNKHRQRAELFLMGVIADESFDSTLEGLEVTGGGPGSVVCKLHVTKKLQNRYGTLHGGCIGEGHLRSPGPALQWLPVATTAAAAAAAAAALEAACMH